MTLFRFVEQEKARYPGADPLCRVLGVSPSGYLRLAIAGTLRPRPCPTPPLAVEIRRSHARSRGTYGVAPRPRRPRRGRATRCRRKRVARLMRADGLAGVHRRRFVRTTDPRRAMRRPSPTSSTATSRRAGPDRLWVADITELPDAGGVLLPRLDRSMPGAGGSSAGRMATHHAGRARHRGPRRGDRPPSTRRPGLIHHSDHGTQYTSLAFGRRLRESGHRARPWARSATATTTRQGPVGGDCHPVSQGRFCHGPWSAPGRPRLSPSHLLSGCQEERQRFGWRMRRFAAPRTAG